MIKVFGKERSCLQSDPMFSSKASFSSSQVWGFCNPVEILFGKTAREQLVNRLTSYEKILVVTQRPVRERLLQDRLLGCWASSTELHWLDRVTENPDLHELQGIIDSYANTRFDAVVGIGGGSALDTAKVLALTLRLPHHNKLLSQLLDSPNREMATGSPRLIAVPSTAGTGSEVTPFATVWDSREKKKYSLSGKDMFPCLSIIDPELTDNLPAKVTLSSGLDAINQATESIWSKSPSPITTSLATRSLQLSVPALLRLALGGESSEARCHMSEASLLAGLAISQTRTSLCHSISYPITSHFGVPHGLACAFTMPTVLRHCIAADDGRMARLASDLVGAEATTDDLLEIYLQLNESLQVRQHVINQISNRDALMNLIPEMLTPGRADNCMISSDKSLLRRILSQSYDG